jgi:hypothetical protein
MVPLAIPSVNLPPETTTLDVLALPQPTAVTTHTPSNLPLPPPPLFRDEDLRSSASGLPRRAGFSGSTERGACREPERDFSSLPMLPPALPDCANAAAGPIATARAQNKAIRT